MKRLILPIILACCASVAADPVTTKAPSDEGEQYITLEGSITSELYWPDVTILPDKCDSFGAWDEDAQACVITIDACALGGSPYKRLIRVRFDGKVVFEAEMPICEDTP